MSSIASRASASVVATTTPLPAASPSALTTSGNTAPADERPRPSRHHRTVPITPSEYRRRRRSAWQTSCCPPAGAAARVGPQQAMPTASKASVSPATSGASGPGTTRSIALSWAKPTRAGISSTPISTHSATAAIPGLPGAQYSLVSSGLPDMAQHNACSPSARSDDQHFHRTLLSTASGSMRPRRSIG